MHALDVLSALTLENGKSWGEVATDWQFEDAEAVLKGEVRRHFWCRPRGGSKTTDLGAICIAVLLEAPPSSRSYSFAADRDQAALLRDAISGFLRRTPEVTGALKVDNFQVTNPKTDAQLQIMASDTASSWGIRPYLTIVDEVGNWPDTREPKELWTSIFSSQPKTPDSRLVVATSPSDPGHWAYRILSDAIGSKAWRVAQIRGPVPWLSEDDLEEQKSLLPAWEYKRLVLGEWVEGGDKLSNVDDVEAAVVLDGPQDPPPTWKKPRPKYVIGLDIGLKNDATVASVCHAEDDVVVLDRQAVWQPTRDEPVQLDHVEAWLLQASRKYFNALVIYDPWNAALMTQNLNREKVRVEEFTFDERSVGRLAVTLHRLLQNRRLHIYDDEGLVDELLNVRIEEKSPGRYKLDHASGKHDDRVVSLALAAHWLVSRPARKKHDPAELARAMERMNADLWQPSLHNYGR